MVTAAGSGHRFGAEKQFVPLTAERRLVDAAVSACRAVASWVGVILPPGRRWDGEPVDATCSGGASRYASIKAGLGCVPPDIGVLLIHSASHPLASVGLAARTVAAVVDGAGEGSGVDGAVPVLDAVDVVKRRGADGSLTTVGREGLGLAQSPMAFRRAVLDHAFDEINEGVEESQLVEAIGGRIVAVDGEITNLHIVDQASLAVARALATVHARPEWCS